MKSVYIIAFALLASSAFFLSCTKDKTPPIVEVDPNCPDTILFSVQVEPIIVQNCSTSGCHNASAAGGYDLLGHSNIVANSTDVLSALRHETQTLMPFGAAQVADSSIQHFQCWVNQGMLDN